MNTTVSVVSAAGVDYPPAGPASPISRPPEYPFPTERGPGDSDVYLLVRQCLVAAGADRANLGGGEWNPLGRFIAPGSRVVVLPNLVMHRRRDRNESLAAFQAKCTQASVIRAVCDYAMIANRSPERISVACAPLQSCDFDAVCRESGLAAMAEFYRERCGDPLPLRDLRATRTRWSTFGALRECREDDTEPWVGVDLGSNSLIEDLYRRNTPVHIRVGDYEPASTLMFHDRGRHVYAISRALLDADVIISVPKLKTHEKVGVTCALKGTVGAIARKECLAHHRLGAPDDGGDEYPVAGAARRLVSALVDRSTTTGTDLAHNAQRVAAKGLSKLARVGARGVMNGAWHGNDTAWRMALDIARVLRYARPDGTVAETPQRSHLVLVDGVVAGEGEGPLRPSPRRCGVVLFGTDVVHADLACARLMGFDPDRIPLLHHARQLGQLPLLAEPGSPIVAVNSIPSGPDVVGRDVGLERFRPPKGWRTHLGGPPCPS